MLTKTKELLCRNVTFDIYIISKCAECDRKKSGENKPGAIMSTILYEGWIEIYRFTPHAIKIGELKDEIFFFVEPTHKLSKFN